MRSHARRGWLPPLSQPQAAAGGCPAGGWAAGWVWALAGPWCVVICCGSSSAALLGTPALRRSRRAREKPATRCKKDRSCAADPCCRSGTHCVSNSAGRRALRITLLSCQAGSDLDQDTAPQVPVCLCDFLATLASPQWTRRLRKNLLGRLSGRQGLSLGWAVGGGVQSIARSPQGFLSTQSGCAGLPSRKSTE